MLPKTIAEITISESMRDGDLKVVDSFLITLRYSCRYQPYLCHTGDLYPAPRQERNNRSPNASFTESVNPTSAPKKDQPGLGPAAIIAVREVFSGVGIKGCNFHFNQFLWRKTEELRLTDAYVNNSEVGDHLKMVAAMGQLPIPYVFYAIML